MRQLKPSRGFTLVELLVVIGIIALLISILLPSLNAARRQANAVKCATQLREIGNAIRFYANDNRNFYPPAQISVAAGNPKYNLDGIDYPVAAGSTSYGAYWFNFLNRYVTKTIVGAGGGNTNTSGGGSAQNGADARRSVLWGCVEFAGYRSVSTGDTAFDTNPVQTGYCYNGYPTFTSDYPAIGAGYPAASQWSWNTDWKVSSAAVGFVKGNIWARRGAERMIVADGKVWLGDAGPPSLTTGGVPRTRKLVPTQYADINQGVSSNETNISLWRHSKLPSKAASTSFYNPNTSKVAYNVLYVDGHVSTESEAYIAYQAIRLRYPG